MKMKIKELREINNIPQKALANILGISSNTLSQYENEKRNPSFEIVAKLSKFFNVSTDYIYGLCTYTICNECCPAYCPNYDLDIETHKEIHLNWVKAKQKYGFNYSLGECERIKGEKRNIVKNLYLPLEERYEAQIEVYKCLFFRCLEANNYDVALESLTGTHTTIQIKEMIKSKIHCNIQQQETCPLPNMSTSKNTASSPPTPRTGQAWLIRYWIGNIPLLGS